MKIFGQQETPPESAKAITAIRCAGGDLRAAATDFPRHAGVLADLAEKLTAAADCLTAQSAE